MPYNSGSLGFVLNTNPPFTTSAESIVFSILLSYCWRYTFFAGEFTTVPFSENLLFCARPCNAEKNSRMQSNCSLYVFISYYLIIRVRWIISHCSESGKCIPHQMEALLLH